MQTFMDDDAGYERWLAGHPDLFVVNAERTPRPSYLVLHRATCRTIGGTPARGARWTADYIKVCGSRVDLEAFAREVGGAARACGLCAP
ncbi:hypothetical protein [Saccharothrix sp.]|uniref:hypothetical protein n=1 Tax=Saccharothrix sp. TaxID=1873460 RepID=UPI0028109CE8|nr:hypothetical protein [Saccharothrix sp.]